MNCTRAREHLPELLEDRTAPAALPDVSSGSSTQFSANVGTGDISRGRC